MSTAQAQASVGGTSVRDPCHAARHRLLAALFAVAPAFAAQAQDDPPLALRGMGSFHIGGREAVVAGRPVREVLLVPGGVPARIDANGPYQVEAMYVQYHLPAAERGTVPLLLWHGGGLTGVTWESTPDGREGWQQYFLRRGWSTYVSDAVERGRSGWAMYPEIFQGEPIFLTKADPWERFRIGAGPGSYRTRTALPGTQFPIEAYDDFMRQVVPRWTTTDAAQLAAYRALLRRAGPAVVLAHSQGGCSPCAPPRRSLRRSARWCWSSPPASARRRPRHWRRCATSPSWRCTATSSSRMAAGRRSASAGSTSTRSCGRPAAASTSWRCRSAGSWATAT